MECDGIMASTWVGCEERDVAKSEGNELCHTQWTALGLRSRMLWAAEDRRERMRASVVQAGGMKGWIGVSVHVRYEV
jgi:hypothetical protein